MEEQKVVNKINPNNLGNLEHININLTHPIPLNTKEGMNVQQIMVLIGDNGSGKSLINKLTWISTFVCSSYIINKSTPLIEFSQYVFDSCLIDNDIDGKMKFEYENGSVEFILTKGKVEKAEVITKESVIIPTNVLYLSTNLRTYDEIKQYLIIRKMSGGPINDFVDDSVMLKLLKVYRLYDVMAIEGFLSKLNYSEIDFPQNVNKSLIDYGINDQYKTLGFDYTDDSIYGIKEDGTRKKFHSYSKGEQSLINMHLMTSLNC